MKIKQPDKTAQRELNSIIENDFDIVPMRKKKYKIRWLHPITTRKINRIMLKEGEDHKVNYKVAAAIILNGLWKLWFVYPILWRWFYYVKQYTEVDLLPVIALGKKKVAAEAYSINTILATDMTTMTMAMTREEASSIHRGQITGQAGS